MDVLLPPDYRQARARFLDLARQDHDIISHKLPDLSGPQGEDLSCDVAARHVPGGEIAIVTTSAIHGVEGYAGSALQQAFLALPADAHVSIVHVHALNPYGFAHDRRADSENIDVNRNFLEAFPQPPHEDEYSRFAHIIVPEPRQHGWLTEAKLFYYATTQQNRMKDIITRGQSSRANGMYYTGLKPSWSRGVWDRIVADHLARYRHVIHLDIHSGLGKSGELQIMAASTQSLAARVAQSLWGESLAFMRDGQGCNTTLSSPTVGEVMSYWTHMAGPKPAQAATYLMEFGTVPPLDVFMALRRDHIAYARGEKDPEILGAVRDGMRRAFAPSSPDWARKVLERGTQAYHQLLLAVDGGHAPL